MFFTKDYLAANRNMAGHWAELWANRGVFNTQNELMVNQYRHTLTPEMLAANAVQGLSQTFWAEIDSQVVQQRDQETGMEIVNDLLSVQTVLPVGKTAKLYNVVGGIAEDVKITMDGQAPYSFDHTQYGTDGDPIPMFTAGYGVNWRHAVGLNTVGIDLVLDSQQAKLREFNKKIVSYMLDGSANINVDGNKPGQGLRNHRNTKKIDLGASGANIDLTTATTAQLIAFFGQGAFGQNARNNKVDAYDVLWVSPEVWSNLAQPYFVNGVISGNVLQAVMPFAPVREIRMTYALTGNQILGYQRRRDVVTPLVGATTGVTALPRPLPQSNFNFQIMAAIGLQVLKDSDGRGGVVYAAVLS